MLWGAFLVQERRPDVENEKAQEICVNKGYREFVCHFRMREEKLPRLSDWHFPFPLGLRYILFFFFPVPKRLSEVGERTIMQRASMLNSYCTLSKVLALATEIIPYFVIHAWPRTSDRLVVLRKTFEMSSDDSKASKFLYDGGRASWYHLGDVGELQEALSMKRAVLEEAEIDPR
jgi:hypothetical protein